MLDLAALVFKVDTAELDGAIQKVDKLTKAVQDATVPFDKLTQATTKATKAQKEAAKVADDQEKAQEKAAKAAKKAADEAEKLASAQKKVNKETEDSSEKVSASSAMLEKQTLSMRILRGETIDLADGAVQLGNSFTKGQAGMLATMKMAGGTADTMKALAASFEEYNRITGLNTFDKSASGISKMQKELKELDVVLELSKTGMALTRDEIVNLVRDTERLTQQFKSEGKSAKDLQVAIEDLQKTYVRDSAALNTRRAEAKEMEDAAKSRATAEIKAAKDMQVANEYITKEMNRVTAAVDNAKEAIGLTASNQLVRMEAALRKSGLSAEEAAAKLEVYKKKLMDLQVASEKNKSDYISRAIAPQITDIVVGLSTGQSPLTVLLQQGGQLRDQLTGVGIAADGMGKAMRDAMTSMLPSIMAVGKGVGEAFGSVFIDAGKAMANFMTKLPGVGSGLDYVKRQLAATGEEGFSMIGKMNSLGNAIGIGLGAALFAGVAALIAFGVALKNVISTQNDLTVAIALSGGSLGITRDEALSLAEGMKSIGVNSFTAIKAVTEIAKAGELGVESVEKVTLAMVNMEKYAGIPMAETAKQFAKVSEEPTKALTEWAAKTGHVNAETLRTVALLEQQGDKAGASKVAVDALQAGMMSAAAEIQNGLSPIEKLWLQIKSNIGQAGQAMYEFATSSAIVNGLSAAWKGLVTVISTVWTAIKGIAKAVGGIAAMGIALVSGEFGLISKINKEMDADFESMKKSHAAYLDEVWNGEKKLQTIEKDKAKNSEYSKFRLENAQYYSKELSKQQRLNIEIAKFEDAQKKGLIEKAEKEALIAGARRKIMGEQKEQQKTATSSLELHLSNEAAVYEKAFNRKLSLQRKFADDGQSILKSELESGRITETQYLVQSIEMIRSGTAEQNAILDNAYAERQNIYVKDIQHITQQYEATVKANRGAKNEVEANTKALDSARAAIERVSNVYADFNEKLGDERAKNRSDAHKKEAEALKALLKPLKDIVQAHDEFNRVVALRNLDKDNAKVMEDSLRWATPEAAARIRAMAEETKFYESQISKTRANVKKLEEALKDISTIKFEGVEIDNTTSEEYQQLEKDLAKARKILNEEVAEQRVAVEKAGVDAVIKYQKDEWKRISDGISESIVTALFEGGKSGGKKLRDFLIAELKKPITVVVQALVNTVSGVMTGNSAGGGLGAGIGGLAGRAGSWLTNSGYSGLGSAFSSFSAGASMAQSGLTGFTTAMEGAYAMMTEATSVANFFAGAMQGIGAAMPYVAAALAVVSLISSMDKSGTIHTGGASKYSASGGLVTGWREAQVSGFGGIDTNKTTTDYTSGIAKTLVTMLDSTAKTFGKAAGYEAATGFADDTSSDGAWGALVIGKLGKTLVDWNDTRQSRWAPKEFADGEAGMKEYQAALAKDTLGVLKDIGLPGWATEMLNSLGDAPTLEELSTIVTTIQQTQVGLANMASVFPQIAAMSDEATTAMLTLSGGISDLSTSMASYLSNYYSESEQYGVKVNSLAKQFKAIGVEMPKLTFDANGFVTNSDEAHKAFRALMEAQNLNTAAGRETYMALLGVQQAFHDVTTAGQEAADAAKELAAEQAKQAAEDAAAAKKAIKDTLTAALDAGYELLQRSIEAQKEVIQSQIDDLTDRVSSLKSVFDLLGTNIKDLYNTVKSTTEMQAAEAHQVILNALATGVVPDSTVLTSAINAVKTKVTGASYATQYEADKARLQLAAELQQLQNLTGVQLTTAEQQLEEAKKQLSALDDLLKQAEHQVNVLKGIDDSVVSVADAIKEFKKLVKDYISGTGEGSDTMQGSGSGSTPAANAQGGSSGFSIGPSGSGTPIQYSAAEQRNNSIYSYFMSTYNGSIESIKQMYADALKYGVTQADFANALSATPTDISSLFARAGIGKFAMGGNHPGGLRIVGENGPELEATGSSRIWNANQTSDMLGNTELAKQVKELKDEVVLMRSETVAIALNTGKSARILDRARGENDGIRTEPVV